MDVDAADAPARDPFIKRVFLHTDLKIVQRFVLNLFFDLDNVPIR